MLTTRPRGTNDILPGEIYKWQFLESLFREVCHSYGYEEIRTPIFEHTELFLRGVGETTDIVEKEMYSFNDRGGRNITLRPEGTASSVRAFLENKLYAEALPQKLFYIGPMFRYDRPQKGRYREFHQFGIEAFGTNSPSIDAEVIAISCDIFERLGLKNLEVHINSVGCPVCRKEYHKLLKNYFDKHKEELCETCNNRLEKNPLRILDCKNEKCQEISEDAPKILDCLCEDCDIHFKKVKELLDILEISYLIDKKLVRGLDYYTNTAFEIIFKGIGSQSAICGGGRYNGLVEECGGPSVPGIGFAMGMERLLLTLEKENIQIEENKDYNIFIASLGEKAKNIALKLAVLLRKKNIRVDLDYMDRSLKSQMKTANKINAQYSIIIGENEIEQGIVNIKNMENSEQKEVSIENIIDFFEGRF